MEEQIRQIAENLDQSGNTDVSLLNSLDTLLCIFSDSWKNNYSKREIREIILTLIRETNYNEVPKKYLCYIYLLKYTADDRIWSLKEVISEDFFNNIHCIQSSIIQNQIYDLVNLVLVSNPLDFYLILDQWKVIFLEKSENIEKFKCFTNMLFYICCKIFESFDNKYLRDFNNKIFKIFSDVYDESDFFSNDLFILKLEYSQNNMFPIIMKYIDFVDKNVKKKLVDNITNKLENISNLKIFVFTLRIPNLLEFIIDSNYYFVNDVTKLILQKGLTHNEYEIRKSTRFILKKVEECTFYKKYLDKYTDKEKELYFNNLNSFLCILECYENFSIHLLKANWDKFENLMINLKQRDREWWINCLVEIGLNHENLNVQKYVAFKTMKFSIKNIDDSFPNWIKKDTFFSIYIRYIVSSLNNKISLQIEELFVEFIYFVLKEKNDWIYEYLIFIKEKIKVFTPLRIMIYPLKVGIIKEPDCLKGSELINEKYNIQNNCKELIEEDIFTIRSQFNIEIQKYKFENKSKGLITVFVPNEYFTELLDLSIPIIKYVPIVLRHHLYFYWIEIMLNYFDINKFEDEELFEKIISFLGIIPEYLYLNNKINGYIKDYFLNNSFNLKNNLNVEKTFKETNKWFELFQFGIGFGRFKQIFGISNNYELMIKNDAIFVSSYYNYEEIFFINDEFDLKIFNLLHNLKALLDNSEEFNQIDLDMLWFDIHFISLYQKCDSDKNKSLFELWNWCIEKVIHLDSLFEQIKESVQSLISFVMIIKCLIHLKKFMNFSSTQQLFEIINNLLIINNNVLLKYLMNHQNIQNWDRIRRKNCKYDIIDTHSINKDKYLIISSCNISIGYPDNYCSNYFKENQINRLIKLFPSNYRDLFAILSQLKFQLINICVLKENQILLGLNFDKEIRFSEILTKGNEFEIVSFNAFYSNFFEHMINLVLTEIEDSDMENLYIWMLIEQLLNIIAKNYDEFQQKTIFEWARCIFELIKKNINELIDNGIYNNYLIMIFNRILTNKNLFNLFEEFDILENILNYYYCNILLNNGNIRFFIFPLLNLIYFYIRECKDYLFINILQSKKIENEMDTDFKKINTIIFIANIIVELFVLEERGLIDGSITRFHEVLNGSNLEFQESFNLYNKCKIYEDYTSFVRHASIIYIYNLLEDSSINENKNFIHFIYVILVLLTQRIDESIPNAIEEKSILDGFNKTNRYEYLRSCLKSQHNENTKETKKFPPLPNSRHHKILINSWQSLCCLIDILKLKNEYFINYILEFYFKHLNYLYTPDIRQYLDLFGSNIVTFYPRSCTKFLLRGLLNNVNNYTQVLYSFLCISSYLILFLKEKIPFPCNNNISESNFLNDFFQYENINWIKVDKDFFEDYNSFFDVFVSYSTSNSALLRNIVLFTLFELYKSRYIRNSIDIRDNMKNYEIIDSKNSLSSIFYEAFSISKFEPIVELLRSCNLYLDIFNKKISEDIFLLNIAILENSKNMKSIIRNMTNNKDTIKMLNNLEKVWNLWKPLKYCSIEHIIPENNLMEFSDQKTSQNFFNCSQSFDKILGKIENSSRPNDENFTQKLLAFQDVCEEFKLNSHLILGDLRPSWSLYYVLRKIICREMSEYYCLDQRKQDLISEEQEMPRSSNYQLKFEPLSGNHSIIEGSISKRQEIFTLKRTDLIILASLVDKIPNIAGLTRTCEIFRVKELLLNTKKVLNDPLFKQISVTAEKWLPINELPQEDIRDYIFKKRMEGYKIFGMEQTSSSVSLSNFSFPRKSILVLGKEKEGIPSDLVSIVDKCIEIPQYGMIRSLNVHVSASILIYEYTKQIMQRV